jgi:hypothetical protein
MNEPKNKNLGPKRALGRRTLNISPFIVIKKEKKGRDFTPFLVS